MRKSCDVTDVAKTFRKSTNTGRDGALIPIKIHKINRASFGVFTECFDDVCDVTRFPHYQNALTTELTLFRISFWGDIVRGSSRLRRSLRGLLQGLRRPCKEDDMWQRRDDLLEPVRNGHAQL